MVYLTSDTHFNHLNILSYEQKTRPFSSVQEMNETIISNWNNVVKDEDDVFVLGDFFMGKLDEIEPILSRLKGHIHLIRGNHDTKNRMKFYESHGIDIHDIYYLPYKGKFFILNHFPIFNEEFFKIVTDMNQEVCVLYGHIHGNAPKGYYQNSYHVGVDTNNMTPISLDSIWKEIIQAECPF